MKKKCTELVFTVNKHSMALAFRSGTPPKTRSTLIGQNSGCQPQSVKEALDNLKRVARGLKESTDGLVAKFTVLSQVAKSNGWKLPDVNAIAQQVLAEGINSHSTGGAVWVKITKLIRQIKAPCPKCPYRLGLVHTTVNPCPRCKENLLLVWRQTDLR